MFFKNNNVKLNNIKISKSFAITQPNPNKISKAITYYRDNKCFDKPIVVNQDNILVDGYTRYLAASKMGLRKIKVTRVYTIEYIYGRHCDSEKTYVWKNIMNFPIARGNFVLVEARDKTDIVKVTNVRHLAKPPRREYIKNVLGVVDY